MTTVPPRSPWAPGPPARLPRGPGRIRRVVAAHPRIADACLVVPLGAWIALLTAGGSLALYGLAQCVPLVWRRRNPMLVFALVAAFSLARWQVAAPSPGDLALLLALYTVAAHEERTRARSALVVLLSVGLVIALAGDSSFSGDRFGVFPELVALGVIVYQFGGWVGNRRAHLAYLEERARRLERERDQQAQLGAAAERARIAREMHDVVAHNLSVMIALADGASFALEATPDRAAQAIDQVSATGREALAEMRRLLGVLREDDPGGDRAPQPGVEDLDALVEQVRAAGLPVTVERSGPARPLPAGAALTVYRLVQESLTNTLKHAGPGATARVRLRYGPDALEVEVVDNGSADPDRPRGAGQGLLGMAERVAVYGGEVDAGPRPEGGWRVHARLAVGPVARPPGPRAPDGPDAAGVDAGTAAAEHPGG